VGEQIGEGPTPVAAEERVLARVPHGSSFRLGRPAAHGVPLGLGMPVAHRMRPGIRIYLDAKILDDG